MIDIANQKVSVPAALFAILSPGLLLQIPDRIPGKNSNFLNTMKTSRLSVITHALVLVLVYHLLAKELGLVLKKADLVVPAVLFVLLSPGMLLSIPPGKGGLLMSGETSLASIAVHALVFALVFALLRSKFPSVY